jgi:dTDP-4-amino-4,6-dideoxygalactose transaminase
MINVTKPFLPPLEEFVPYLSEIWDRRILTNGGPFHQQLEQELCNYLGVKHVALFTNGTLALMTALKALRITGEVITTPYSFVATSHALVWNNLKPVFVDIDPVTFAIDPKKIEEAITPQTTAILAVHCYGYPCDVEAIQAIADTYNLKVIYDAAHAFGVSDNRGSILNYGDLTILSFHATKVFNTFEGGAIVCPDEKIKRHIDHLKNFGFSNETSVISSGINGKMSEVNAALGLLQLKYVDQAINRRREIDSIYRNQLSETKGITLTSPIENTNHNYAYFPIRVEDDFPISRDGLYEYLKTEGILSRRYFYPLISEFSMYKSLASSAASNLTRAKEISERILCLPIYPDLTDDEVEATSILISKLKDKVLSISYA